MVRLPMKQYVQYDWGNSFSKNKVDRDTAETLTYFIIYIFKVEDTFRRYSFERHPSNANVLRKGRFKYYLLLFKVKSMVNV